MKKSFLLAACGMTVIVLGMYNIVEDRSYAKEFRKSIEISTVDSVPVLSDAEIIYQALQTQKMVTIEPGGSLCRSLGMTPSEAYEFTKMYDLKTKVGKNRKRSAVLQPGDQFVYVFVQSLNKHVWFPRVNNLCLDVD